MQHIWSIICSKSINDRDTNLLSLIDMVEEINIRVIKEGDNKKISIIAAFEIIHYLTKDITEAEENGELLIELLDQNAKSLSKLSQSICIPKEFKRIRVKTSVEGLSFSEPGRYYFRISFKNSKDKSFKIKTQIPLDVNFIE